MKKFGKFSLLLVVIGWFCPISCNLTGLQWLHSISDGGSVALYSLALLASVIFALLGIIIAIKKFNSPDSSGKESNIHIILSATFGAPFFIFMVVNTSIEILNFGAYLMIAGWTLSLISIFFKEK